MIDCNETAVSLTGTHTDETPIEAVRSFRPAVVNELLVEMQYKRRDAPQCDCMPDESACTCELLRIAEQPRERILLAKPPR